MGVFGGSARSGGARAADADVVPEAGVDARVAGAWARDPVSVLSAWVDVQARVDAIAAEASAGSGELDELSVPQRYTLGVFFAARWTLGGQAHRPLSGIDSPVTEQALRAEVAAAEYLILTDAPAWDLAAGVRAWIGWLVGAKDALEFPQPRA